MRHLRSILYALVLAPAVWILCGVGFDQDLTGRARDNGGIESLSGVLLLVLAGAAYAILLFSPISPAGPLLAGLAFLGVGAWARIAPDSYAGVWPADVAKDGFDVSAPGYGLAVLLAVPLLATALSARRWRAFEPPEIVLLGTLGRARGAARVAGTPADPDRTTVIPQHRQAAGGFGESAADVTQIVPPSRRARGLPGGDDEQTGVVPLGATDDDEKTTVIRLEPQPAEEPTQLTPTEDATSDLSANEPTADVAANEPTADVAASESTGDDTTRLVVPAGPDASDDAERTQLLTPRKADGRKQGTTDDGQEAHGGTVEPPADRTQVLTFPAPGEATTVETPADANAETKAMSIVAAERPDPGEDPTTRITPLVAEPGAATTRPNPQRGAMTVTSLERPADEAADDTRSLTLPTPRAAADEDTTRHL